MTSPLPTPEPVKPSAYAFFLDVDGTLLPIAAQFDEVCAGENEVALIRQLSSASSGAVALVSGRSIESLDQIFYPLELPAGGLHGTELRMPGGVTTALVDPAELHAARQSLSSFELDSPGVRLEDKGRALALHYRQAPQMANEVREAAELALKTIPGHFALQEGKMVIEIKSSHANKGSALRRLLSCKPFAGRPPLFIGDDITDEKAFQATREAGGLAIRVGPPSRKTAAAYQLENVGAVQQWLAVCLKHKPE